MYAIRRTRDGFKMNRTLENQEEIDAAVNEAKTTMEVIKRQSLISTLYPSDKLVIESKNV